MLRELRSDGVVFWTLSSDSIILTEQEHCSAPIIFVVALDCEARPLLSHFNLGRRHDIHTYRVYQSVDTWLIVSGVGKVAAANAVGFMSGLLHQSMLEYAIWINIGIARHAHLALGSCCWVSRAEDDVLKKALFPVLTVPLPCMAMPCITVDETVTRDQSDFLHDREASAFVFSASRVTTLEWIHAFKVVSDNQENPPDRIEVTQVKEWITHSLEGISSFINHLQDLRSPLLSYHARENALFDCLVKMQPFSESRRHQLRRLCRRILALQMEQNLDWESLQGMANAHSVLQALEGLVENHPIVP